MELSDDLEPVSLTAPGYRGDQGGWGFYYLNLTQALMGIYRNPKDDSTILAVCTPLEGACVSGRHLKVAWSVIGVPAASYRIEIDGAVVEKGITDTDVTISLDGLAKGRHILTVVAEGAHTCYPLARECMDIPLETGIPVSVSVSMQLI